METENLLFKMSFPVFLIEFDIFCSKRLDLNPLPAKCPVDAISLQVLAETGYSKQKQSFRELCFQLESCMKSRLRQDTIPLLSGIHFAAMHIM